MKKLFLILALLPGWLNAQVVCTSTPHINVSTATFNGTATSLIGTTEACSVGASSTAASVCEMSNSIVAEGTTADNFETTLAFGDATADASLTLTGVATGVDATGFGIVQAAGATTCPDTANGVCLGANAIVGEGTTANAFENTIAFGDATADQTLTCTGAASSFGCVVASPAVPTNGTTAGNSLALTASPAIPNAGAGTDGAAAGGSITLTAGAAARDTSGNADGGDVILVGGAGIGTGLDGTVVVPNGNTSTNPGIHGSDSDTGISFASGEVSFLNNGTRYWYVTGGTFQANGSTPTIAGQGGYITGLTHFVATVSTTQVQTVGHCSALYTNGADVDGQSVTLMDNPTVGCCLNVALTSTDTSNSFAIAPSAGETLQDAGTACATSFSATAKGATARICAVSGGSGGLWLVMSKNGTWTCS